jgi:uncharacterized membrane protein YgcG
MALSDNVIWLAGLCEIVLPSRTIRLCDGAFVTWDGNTYTSEDEDFGTIEAIDQVAESISDEAPSGKLTMLPPSIAAAADLFQPEAQGSPMRFWLAEINQATGAVVGTPENLFSGFLNTLNLTIGRQRRAVEIEFMSEAERLFWTKEGNVLSPRFHKSVWAGELGLDFATGTQLAVPWGVAGPGRGTISIGGGGSSGGGGGMGGVSLIQHL